MLLPLRALVAALALVPAASCSPADAPGSDDAFAGSDALFSTEIHVAAGLGTLETDLLGPDGRPVAASCGTCHALIEPRDAGPERDFHKGIDQRHGQVSCLACHDAENRDQLRLADGSPVPFGDALALCGQCHGPQTRDYHDGSHGGMNGYWDLTRGPRVRNGCLDCHEPHAPQIPQVQPVLPPRDRFLHPPSGADHE
jgi:hypothetical protein